VVLGAVELIGSQASGSFMVLGDALHVCIDAAVMGMSGYVSFRACSMTHLPSVKRLYTHGQIFNGALLVLAALLLTWHAWPLLQETLAPHELNHHATLWVIVIALLGHLTIYFGIRSNIRPDPHGEGVKESALWHALEDVTVMIVALVGLGLAEQTGSTRFDVWFSAGLAAVFAWRGVKFVYQGKAKLSELRWLDTSAPPGA